MSVKNRNADFKRRCLELYHEAQRRGIPVTPESIVARAIDSPPQCFYVDPVYAYNKVLRILAKGTESIPSTPAGCMWLELTAMVRAELLRRPAPVVQALGHVLNRRHPSAFHISFREGMRIARTLFHTHHTIHRPRRAAKTPPAP